MNLSPNPMLARFAPPRRGSTDDEIRDRLEEEVCPAQAGVYR